MHRGMFIGDRAEIRQRAAQYALDMIRRQAAGREDAGALPATAAAPATAPVART